MTKRVQWLPNERVDIPDMDGGTNLLSVGLMQQWVDRMVLDHFPRVAAGFRVQIANQTTSPGQLSVFNGVAFDRGGQILQNEDEENTSRSVTLLANGTYYIEAQFVATPSDTDARAFWDPSVDNGTDPSGDPRLPGQETSQNVSTRLSPDWTIVSPVSTTNFEINTNANSLKVPVAVITVAGGVITGATTSPPVSILGVDVLAGVTSIKCLDTVIFPDGFTANLGAEAITVTANDRFNGILTLAAGLVGNHSVGERLTQTGGTPNQFLVDRMSSTIPIVGTADARPHFWQGDPNRGYALQQDPFSAAGRSDALVQTLKDKVDELAAQVRELKFGAARDADVGKLAPASSFPASPREFDLAAGVLGAKTNTVSIGDGVTTWGDFNVTQEGSYDACIAAAVSALGSAGGAVYIKRGNYTSAAVQVLPTGRWMRIFGDADNATSIQSNGTASLFQCGNGTLVHFQDLAMTSIGGTPSPSVVVHNSGSVATIKMTRVQCEGLVCDDGASITDGAFYDCTFNNRLTQLYAVKGDFTTSHFVKCELDARSAAGNAGARALMLGGTTSFAAGTDRVSFTDCWFQVGSSATGLIELKGTHAHNYAKFEHCQFDGTAITANIPAILAPTATTTSVGRMVIEDCVCNMPGGLLDIDHANGLIVRGCEVDGINSTGAFGIRLLSVNCRDVSISECSFFQSASSGAFTAGIWMVGCAKGSVRDCLFNQVDIAVYVVNGEELSVRNNRHTGGGRMFFYLEQTAGALTNSVIESNSIDSLIDPSSGPFSAGGNAVGVCLGGASATASNVRIVNNEFAGIGPSSGSSVNAAIMMVAVSPFQIVDCLVSGNQIGFVNSGNTGQAYGVRLWASANANQLKRIAVVNNSINSTGLNALVGAGIQLTSVIWVTCSNNNIVNVGQNIASGLFAGIDMQDVSDSTIIGNNVNTVNGPGAANAAGITLHQRGNNVVIANNTVDVVNANIDSINVMQTNTDATSIVNIEVVNNICGTSLSANCVVGIRCYPSSTPGSTSWKIANNIIRGFAGVGIMMLDIVGTGVTDFTISGNDMKTSNAGTEGIQLINVNRFRIQGNSIYLTDTTADFKKAIDLNSSGLGIIMGNSCWVATVAANAVIVSQSGGTGNNLYVGNYVETINVATAKAFVVAGASAYADGNATLNFTIGNQYVGLTTTGNVGQNWA
jgi:hypothetical protein